MTRKCITTAEAPKAIGPYSQANSVEAGRFLFCSGQIPIDPHNGELVKGGIATQTERVLRNLQAVLEAAAAKLENVVKTTVYLKNMDDFAGMNDVYRKFFPIDPPARAAVQVAKLPLDAAIEIEAIAAIE